MLEKLKNPQVLIALVPLCGMLFMQFGVMVDMDWLNNTLAIICSILILLGILNNPDTEGFDNPLKNNKDKLEK